MKGIIVSVYKNNNSALDTTVKSINMKAKVQLTDSYSGRSINVIVNLENTEFDKYEFTFSCLSDWQRKKIEDFFGELNAYHTTHEIIKTYE